MSSSSSDGKKRVLVPIAEDSEEIETSSITDVLTRFGAEVVVASVQPDGELVCKMSRGLKICADVTIENASKEEWPAGCQVRSICVIPRFLQKC